jgi:trans-aconitate methyltransferase
MDDMWYLDTNQAKPIFEKQADIIIENNYKGIVDVGCRHGPINAILEKRKYKDYDYYGFDTSIEPIDIAKYNWRDNDRIIYEQNDWANLNRVNFNVDCIIFSGVLLYETDHYKMFKETMSFYNCEHAIIQEPYHTQKHYDTRLVLKTITEDMSQYNFKEEFIIDTDIFCGRRLVAHI